MKRRLNELRTPAVLVSSSSSDDLSVLGEYTSASASLMNSELAQRNIRPRTNPPTVSTPFPTAYTTSLQEILTRYHNWSTAVTFGNTGASKKAVSELCNNVATDIGEKHVCTLCLDGISPGENYTTLSCGHVFHTGDTKDEDTCKGILYWLKSNLTCPHCRSALEPAVPVPSPSEQVIVPLLNRQFALIQAQARLIERQRRDLQRRKADSQTPKSSKRGRTKLNGATDLLLPANETTVQPLAGVAELDPMRPNQWQDGVEHHEHREVILKRVTKIAVSALNWRLVGCSSSKIRKLNTLAAKVELLLFSEAASLEEYRDVPTLRKRVLQKIKGLICRAKELRRVRHGNPVAPVGSLVF